MNSLRDLIELFKSVEEKDSFGFTKTAVRIILKDEELIQDYVVYGASQFGQFEEDRRLKGCHKALILWAAVEKRNVNLIQRLCLSGPLFPLTYVSDEISPPDKHYQAQDILAAESDDGLAYIAAWVD